MTLWELLGVPRGCPTEELTRAYRKKCLELHPDKTGNDPNKTKLFVSMKAVYEGVLKRRQVEGIEKPLPPQETVHAETAASRTYTTTNWGSMFFSSQDLYKIWEQMVADGTISRQTFDQFQKKRNMAGDIFRGKTGGSQ